MSVYRNLAKRQVARQHSEGFRPGVGNDVKGFIRGYTKDKSIPKNKRLWSPMNSSALFPVPKKKNHAYRLESYIKTLLPRR